LHQKNKMMNKIREFGLIGYPLGHSYSENYFNKKFETLGLTNFKYHTFPLTDLSKLNNLIRSHNNLIGLNVTTPYKEAIIPYLNSVDKEVIKTGVVNTIIIARNYENILLKGFNTDVFGIEETLSEFELSGISSALILGSGGSAKTLKCVLEKHGIKSKFVSRYPNNGNQVSYRDVQKQTIISTDIIINSTPVGMYPNHNLCPDIPYQFISENHICIDLVYNPEKTLFLEKCEAQGAKIKNGLTMLYEQADKAWELWLQEIEKLN
jgi:shikimate dehydrogenase